MVFLIEKGKTTLNNNRRGNWELMCMGARGLVERKSIFGLDRPWIGVQPTLPIDSELIARSTHYRKKRESSLSHFFKLDSV